VLLGSHASRYGVNMCGVGPGGLQKAQVVKATTPPGLRSRGAQCPTTCVPPVPVERSGGTNGGAGMNHKHHWLMWNRWLRWCTECYKASPYRLSWLEGLPPEE